MHPSGLVSLLTHVRHELVSLLQFGEGKLSSAALFASSSADGTVRVWSARCWSCLAILACQGPDHSLPLLATVMSDKYAHRSCPCFASEKKRLMPFGVNLLRKPRITPGCPVLPLPEINNLPVMTAFMSDSETWHLSEPHTIL